MTRIKIKGPKGEVEIETPDIVVVDDTKYTKNTPSIYRLLAEMCDVYKKMGEADQ